MDGMSRRPPPIPTGTETALAMSRITSRFLGVPAMAPSRSTRWSRGAPSASHRRATATGSSANTVSWSYLPWYSRTQRPSLRSMAGITWNSILHQPSEVVVDLQSQLPALFRVELGPHYVPGGNGRGEGYAILSLADYGGAPLGVHIVGVDEVEVAVVGDALPQWVRR